MTKQIRNINYTRPWMAEYQKQILDSEKRFTVVEASTKTGKTASHIVWLFEQALKGSEGHNFWWVAPIYSQSEIAFKRMKRQISNKEIYKANASKLILTLINGAEIHFKSADKPDSLYGEDVYAAVFDEFTRAKESAWWALRSTLTATNGKCKFIGNYTGSTNWGHKLGKKAKTEDSEYAYFKITAYDAVHAGILDEKEIDQAREDLPLSIFKALYLAEGSLDEDILFDAFVLNGLFDNSNLNRGSKRYITADVALHGSDAFVICVWYGFVIVDIIKIEKCDASEVEKLLRATAKKHKVPLSNIVYDADGLGSFLRGYLKAARPFNNGAKAKKNENYANLKSQCFYKLAKRLADGGMKCEVEIYKEEIMQELEVIRKHKVDKEGKLRVTPKDAIKELIGRSPDFADSIMMREYVEIGFVVYEAM